MISDERLKILSEVGYRTSTTFLIDAVNELLDENAKLLAVAEAAIRLQTEWNDPNQLLAPTTKQTFDRALKAWRGGSDED